MRKFNQINNATGWIVAFIAFVVYAITMEETASFWDCGEFIAVSYKLMVPHPPGAPFFLLVNRIFSFLSFGDVEAVSYWINMQSVLSSAVTILFLFWSIVLLGRKVIKAKEGQSYSTGQIATLMAGAAIGSLAYTFSDSFWFSAVEAEVYAMSSVFTAFVFWAILRWEYIEDEAYANRWLIMIAYTIGLSIGVHLLNLLAIPALGLIYYFKKYPKVTYKGMLVGISASFAIILIIMVGIIPGLPSLAGSFEVFFVNSIGLPFGSGVFILVVSLLGGLVYGIYYSHVHKMPALNTALLGFAFVLVGYSSYGMVIIRSNYNPPINENAPNDLISFVSYLKREQYGNRPLLYGQTFMAEQVEIEQGAPVYQKGKNKYEVVDYRSTPVYDNKNQMLLPRIYSKQPGHPQLYRSWIGLREGQKPNMADNIFYMFRYQFGHMYLRYFMWNFAGRESDYKDAGTLMPWEDLGVELPDDLARNKGRSNFYFLPLILGLIGIFYQQRKDKRGFIVLVSIFFLMGLGLVLYLNSPPVEPRERDYIYVGSFYAFAIWIGFGVFALAEGLGRLGKGLLPGLVAGLICLPVPMVMAVNGWANHDRSNRFHSIDQARNTLASCAENAILFTGGDNDTFPLWYIQNVEGYRTDVRVAVMSYFSTDWYLEQMRSQQYESTPMPLTIKQENYRTGKNDYVPLLEEERAKGGVNVSAYINLVNEDDPRVKVPLADGTSTARLLSRNFVLNVDVDAAKAAKLVPESKQDRIVDKMTWKLKDQHNSIFKNELALLDLIVSNKDWSRPIYFNNTSANTLNMDLRPYLQMEGMAYRLVPIIAEDPGQVGEVNVEQMLENIEQWQFRGFDDPSTYNDEEYRKFGANTRNAFYRLANTLYQENRNAEALEILDMALEKIPDATIPYSYFMPRYIDLYHRLGDHERAKSLADTISTRATENLAYLLEKDKDIEDIRQRSMMILQSLAYIYRDLEREADQNIGFIEQQAGSSLSVNPELDIDNISELEELREFYSEKSEEYGESFYNLVSEIEEMLRGR